jgi:hypothetical protein
VAHRRRFPGGRSPAASRALPLELLDVGPHVERRHDPVAVVVALDHRRRGDGPQRLPRAAERDVQAVARAVRARTRPDRLHEHVAGHRDVAIRHQVRQHVPDPAPKPDVDRGALDAEPESTEEVGGDHASSHRSPGDRLTALLSISSAMYRQPPLFVALIVTSRTG